jgi:hypothetical protein
MINKAVGLMQGYEMQDGNVLIGGKSASEV